MRTYGDYLDLGSVRGVTLPKRQLHASVSVALTPRQSVSLTYARQDASILGGSRILSLGYNASFGSRVSLFANAFRDRDQAQSLGLYLGVIVNLDHRISVSLSASRYGDANTLAASASQSIDYDKGGFGWNVLADGGNAGYRHDLGRLDYQGSYGDVSAQVEHSSTAAGSSFTTRSLYATGSLVLMDGALLASRPISDAFAVVTTNGTPDVPVLRENRVVGDTSSGGHLLIPDLLSYNANHLAIDTLNLPVDAEVETDHLDVVPRGRSGVLARFPVSRYQGAVVVLQDEQGRPLPVGTAITLQGDTATYTLGYDGQVFFPHLQPGGNVISAKVGDILCMAHIEFSTKNTMQTMGPYTCKPGGTP
ncbi:fimbria/pilus outer membrane usher protein [Dyella terrae]|uniref:fimbria/pilus outer membrane usher protein n=1 Tax=Dyella terrae TaxID=522259 RepID=UPI001EFCA98B|nr:fimbria/pilus outer membrane usher protein [Dyella terrae]ULU27130.1 fimbria/pilus outer membrane usher protein [Dyella terrae]